MLPNKKRSFGLGGRGRLVALRLTYAVQESSTAQESQNARGRDCSLLICGGGRKEEVDSVSFMRVLSHYIDLSCTGNSDQTLTDPKYSSGISGSGSAYTITHISPILSRRHSSAPNI
jgi:hypothetical protein